MADARIDITALPDALFASIATSVARPSQVAFAVAVEGLPGPKRAVLSSPEEWSTLDFGEVEASLASKLSDGDLHRMLTTVDAANNLKALKLTGCTAITGSGLAQLAGSPALEVIDLVAGSNHSLSSDVVVPIISSIIDNWASLELPNPQHSWKVHAGERCLDLPASFCDGSRHFPIPKSTEIPPRRNQSSLSLYTDAVRGGISYQARIVAIRRFEALSVEERAHWDLKAVEDKNRYMLEVAEYERKKKRAKLPPSVCDENVERFLGPYAHMFEEISPTRNKSSFFLYAMAVRDDVKAANPEARFGEIAQITSRHFKALPAEERAYWDQKSAEDIERFRKELEKHVERRRLKLTGDYGRTVEARAINYYRDDDSDDSG